MASLPFYFAYKLDVLQLVKPFQFKFFLHFFIPLSFFPFGQLFPDGSFTIANYFSRVNNFLTLNANYFSLRAPTLYLLFTYLFTMFLFSFWMLSTLPLLQHPKPEHLLFIFFAFLIFAKHYFLSLDTNFLIFFLHCATSSAIRSIFKRC